MKNRVNPKGEIFESIARGTLMGNRGVLHDRNGIIRSWKSTAWITCRLDYKNNKRTIMAPGRYTELFFLDEATSFSAGHRPCSLCRYNEANHFKNLWKVTFHADRNTGYEEIDKWLHFDRITEMGLKKSFEETFSNLPNGSFVKLTYDSGEFYLKYDKYLLRWSEYGYDEKITVSVDYVLVVLTPRSIIEIFKAGYLPTIHQSGLQLL